MNKAVCVDAFVSSRLSCHSCLILSWSLCFSAYLFLNHSFSRIFWNDGISNPPLFFGRVSISPIHALLGIFIHLLTCLLQSASKFNLVQVVPSLYNFNSKDISEWMYCFKIFSLVCGLTFSPDVMFSSSSSLVRIFTLAVLFFSSKSNIFPRYVNESPIVTTGMA